MSKLTWNKELKIWLHDGLPSERRRWQRGRNPVRRKRHAPQMSSRAIMRELDRQEREKERQGWLAMGYTPERAAYMVSFSSLPHRLFVKFIKHELKRDNGKCGGFGSHSWKGGNGRCNKCGALSPSAYCRVLRALPPKLDEKLSISKKELRKLAREKPERLVWLIKRERRERRKQDRNAALLARATEMGFIPPSERVRT
jgi:hypothetical protein